MEVNKLMIGDWVLFEPLKESISTERVVGLGEGVIKIRQFWVSMKEIKPIPLTAEILEKNGFSDNYADDDLSYAADAVGDIIGVHILGQGGLMDEMYFDYVHQLQHALRLCGIDKEIVL